MPSKLEKPINTSIKDVGSDVKMVIKSTRGVKVDKLASLYSREKRIQETICIGVGITELIIVLFLLLNKFQFSSLIPTIFCAFLGILSADLLSGFFHWLADTWGSVDTFIGRNFIRSFREHHLDPSAMTRHDFIECNGDNLMLIIPKLSHIICQHMSLPSEELELLLPMQWYWLFLAFYISMTNQIHKWSHTFIDLPWWVEQLQLWRIILSRTQHKRHHLQPHNCCYCITTGWLNEPLDRIKFWRFAENIVTKVTGMQPRSDDLKWAKTS